MGGSESDRCEGGCRVQPPQISKTKHPKIDPPAPPRIRAADFTEPLDYLSFMTRVARAGGFIRDG
jgi:hypothetical protein